MLWAFCVYVEAVSVAPQVIMMQRNRTVERFTGHYVFFLGLARFFSCAHWLLQMVDDRNSQLWAVRAPCPLHHRPLKHSLTSACIPDSRVLHTCPGLMKAGQRPVRGEACIRAHTCAQTASCLPTCGELPPRIVHTGCHQPHSTLYDAEPRPGWMRVHIYMPLPRPRRSAGPGGLPCPARAAPLRC